MYLPESDCRYMVRARQILDILDNVADTAVKTFDSVQDDHETTSTTRRIKTDKSPYMNMFSNHHPVRIVVDSEVTDNMIRHTNS